MNPIELEKERLRRKYTYRIGVLDGITAAKKSYPCNMRLIMEYPNGVIKYKCKDCGRLEYKDVRQIQIDQDARNEK